MRDSESEVSIWPHVTVLGQIRERLLALLLLITLVSAI